MAQQGTARNAPVFDSAVRLRLVCLFHAATFVIHLAMVFIRYPRIPRRLIANVSPSGPKSRRMASFYNIDVAGLTDEQVEVR